ncbi:aspartate--tRNA ligase [Granulicella mallensis]|uniref:Aspartate--tRNA(Asp/Asn) ligase n=1 Tax=Granulicella mallensis (strain ATCC BAA-1857 / DSM 23137 / MP5ACTX8) TaxID=682795 RepID=G8NUZ8_GRAMM|nr:aspartate--tRNA ligase [Granulicella mallensis]AEU38768.1 aspartyl-tRNA synthetase [Granulicella mallensis MP5ACTX8]
MTLDFLGTLQRTHMCGELRSSDAGTTVTLMGWVNRRRDHGNLIFLDVRDRTGITQIVLDKEASPEAHAKAEAARPEYVVAVTGKVRVRGQGLANPNMVTGDIEVVGNELLLLNEAKTPPFSPAEDAIANEEVRLKYRYLDLRRVEMQKNFAVRSRVAMAIRNFLVEQGFLEIETPFMTRSTPEGARDYLVPSRVHPGHFYALPQSPQIFKQILMISGFDKYFQIARCFRDEDLRADRQPEFTQIDLEMTFPRQETIFRVVEGFLQTAFKAAGIELGNQQFVQMTYDQAIARYGIDKPDMRLPAMVDLSAELTAELRETLKVDPTLPVLGFTIPRVGELSGTARKALVNEIRGSFGDCGLDFLDVSRLRTNEAFVPLAEAIAAKLTAEQIVFNGENFTTEDLAVVITPKPGTPAKWNHDPQWIWKRVGALRLELAKKYADKHGLFTQTGTAADFKFLWVTDFPMYEWNEEAKTWDAAHHPFTSPHEDDITSGRLVNDKGAVRALAYDIVLNGTELGSGSIRIHRQDVQAEIFRSLGMTDEEAKARFGFFLDALEYGTPPHGGIALGLDRIVMILAGASSLREVIAFPKTAKAIDLMVDAPTPVSEQQMRELSLRTVTRS